MYDLGDVVHLEAGEVDAQDNPETVDNVSVSIRQPDGTDTTPVDVDPVATGKWVYDFAPDQAGRHVARWSGDGYAYTDVFDVWPDDPRMLFGLAEARKQLQWRTPMAAREDQLRLFIAAVTPVIEDIVGPLIVATHVRTVDGGDTAIVLPDLGNSDVSAVSVTENGHTVPVTVDKVNGIVYRGSSLAPIEFAWGRQNVVVTYTVGAGGVIPPNVKLAGLEEFRFLWQNGQQATKGRAAAGGEGDPDDVAWTPAGFAVPRRVIELCAPHARVGGFA